MFICGTYKHEEDAEKAVRELIEAEFLPRDIVAITPVGKKVKTVRPVDRYGLKIGAPFGILIGIIGGVALSGLLENMSLLVAGAVGALIGMGLGLLAALSNWKVKLELPDHDLGPVYLGVDTVTREADAERALRSGEPETVSSYAVRQTAVDEARKVARTAKQGGNNEAQASRALHLH